MQLISDPLEMQEVPLNSHSLSVFSLGSRISFASADPHSHLGGDFYLFNPANEEGIYSSGGELGLTVLRRIHFRIPTTRTGVLG